MADKKNLLFVNKQLTEARKNKEGDGDVVASAFDEYGLIGRNFSKEHNFAMYLPSDFINDGTLKENKHIHVVMLGFGKSAEAILQTTILNNQFIKIENDKYAVEPIQYHLYDTNESAFKKEIISKFNSDKPKYIRPTNSLPDIELTAKIECKVLNFPNDLLELPQYDEQNDFVFYFVSVGDPIDNLTLVNSLLENSINKKNSVIFYCADSKEEEMKFSIDARIFPFGFKNDVLSKDNIVDDVYDDGAVKVNQAYNELNAKKQKFTTLDIIEKLSNFYSLMNVEFKLNLMGFTFKCKDSAKEVTKEDFIKEYGISGRQNKYEDYFALKTSNALIYQEHARWNMYYYMNGFNPMSLDEMKLTIDENGDCQHKDIEHKKHGCLTTHAGLDQLHRFEANTKLEKNPNMSLEEALKEKESYRYDAMNLDNIVTEFSNKIYKLWEQE